MKRRSLGQNSIRYRRWATDSSHPATVGPLNFPVASPWASPPHPSPEAGSTWRGTKLPRKVEALCRALILREPFFEALRFFKTSLFAVCLNAWLTKGQSVAEGIDDNSDFGNTHPQSKPSATAKSMRWRVENLWVIACLGCSPGPFWSGWKPPTYVRHQLSCRMNQQIWWDSHLHHSSRHTSAR